jgi:hypothetical protein
MKFKEKVHTSIVFDDINIVTVYKYHCLTNYTTGLATLEAL